MEIRRSPARNHVAGHFSKDYARFRNPSHNQFHHRASSAGGAVPKSLKDGWACDSWVESVWAINWRITLRMSDIISFSDWISSVVASQAESGHLEKQTQGYPKPEMGRSKSTTRNITIAAFLPKPRKVCICGEATSGALKTFLNWKKSSLWCQWENRVLIKALTSFYPELCAILSDP